MGAPQRCGPSRGRRRHVGRARHRDRRASARWWRQASAPLPAPLAIDGGLRQDPELWWHGRDQGDPRGRPPRSRAIGSIRWPSTAPRARCCCRRAWHAARARRACTTTPAPPIWPRGSRPQHRPRAARMARPRRWHGCWCCRSGIPTRGTRCIRPTGSRPRLTGRLGLSDENNALKLGYDPVCPPLARTGSTSWACGASCCPRSWRRAPRSGPMQRAAWPRASAWHRAACVVAGTTDGCASFLATGADAVGDGVTALGTTLTLKLLSDRPGVRARRTGSTATAWAIAGWSAAHPTAAARRCCASSPPARMAELTPRLRPDQPDRPALAPPARAAASGSRWPIPTLAFEPEPLPTDEALLFQGLLEGIAEVEERAYRLLDRTRRPAAALGPHGRRRCRQPRPGWRSAPGCSACRCCRRSISEAGLRRRAAGAGAPREAAGLAELAAFSARLGRDPEQVQAAGGNTSLKADGLLWVKASGLWLADALDRDLFVPVALAPVLRRCRGRCRRSGQRCGGRASSTRRACGRRSRPRCTRCCRIASSSTPIRSARSRWRSAPTARPSSPSAWPACAGPGCPTASPACR